MRSLRSYKDNPQHILSTALSIFRSKNTKTIFVEGVCDKRFLSQWLHDETKIRFDVLDGKDLVIKTFKKYQEDTYRKYDNVFFIADVDYDIISNRKLLEHKNFIYNAYCPTTKTLFFNDLECFLINTSAFKKILINLDFDAASIESTTNKLEKASRIPGSLRAADEILQKEFGLSNSILNGFEIDAFFNGKNIAFNESELYTALPRWSNYDYHVDDLITKAEELRKAITSPWFLSRGHDITKMIELYLLDAGHKGYTSSKIELMLRLACDKQDFASSPMGNTFISSGFLPHLKMNDF